MYSTWDSLVSFRYDCGLKSSFPPWRRDFDVEVSNSTGGVMVSLLDTHEHVKG